MEGQTNQKILHGRLQRRLRNSPTDAEQCIWQYLRRRQISGAKFRRQHPFEDYILDFLCFDPKSPSNSMVASMRNPSATTPKGRHDSRQQAFSYCDSGTMKSSRISMECLM